ncbi:hypothetical protein [Cryobacterium sp.]|jgi:hypothetical protein|uniref:hypothetical protein n=1 Tax=Cryobacterium sp. TaxID=1926290 RepID=UPI00260C60E9|nr:hypothetical protein [Cryobacterium sp.]MCU1447783.1 hypothetical protein [Cryobacterium sp.]
METFSGSIRPDVIGELTGEAAAALARLREQRWRLDRLRREVEAAGRRLAGQQVGPGWRSAAQRAYEERLADLVRGLQGAWRALDDALYAVDVAIDCVKAAR